MVFHFGRFGCDKCKLSAVNQHRRDRQVTHRDCWSLTKTNFLAVDKTKERENCTGGCEIRCLHELSLDNEHPDCAENQSSQDCATPQDFQAFVENSGLREFIQPDGRRVGPGRGQGVVNLKLAPCGDMWR